MSQTRSRRLDFDTVHEKYRQRILRFLEGMVGPAEAEELTQETFLKVSRALDGFQGKSKLSTWIYRIATNAALDRLRSRSSPERSPEPSSIEGEEMAGVLPDFDVWSGEERPAAAQALAREEMYACIRGVVDALPDHYKAVIVLSEIEGLKDREIAQVLGGSAGAVKIRLHRAREQLKAALEAKCSFDRDERNVFGCEPKPIALTDMGSKKKK